MSFDPVAYLGRTCSALVAFYLTESFVWFVVRASLLRGKKHICSRADRCRLAYLGFCYCSLYKFSYHTEWAAPHEDKAVSACRSGGARLLAPGVNVRVVPSPAPTRVATILIIHHSVVCDLATWNAQWVSNNAYNFSLPPVPIFAVRPDLRIKCCIAFYIFVMKRRTVFRRWNQG